MSEVTTNPTVTLTGVGLPGDETAAPNQATGSDGSETKPASSWLAQNWLAVLAVIAFALAGWLWLRSMNTKPTWPGP